MFYSHEVLTSRKYGVATVWRVFLAPHVSSIPLADFARRLVATLGSKSTLKKVSRKAILDVDVSKACETIVTPEAPMALRLQSNLLYGVTRVYAQQCGYVLADAEAAKNSMRAVLRVMQTADLEPEGANKGRIDQLVLQDDPNFLPDLDLMPLDFNNLNFDETTMVDSQQVSLSPHSSQYISGSQMSVGGLMIPPSQSSLVGGSVGGADIFGIRGDYSTGKSRELRRLLDDDIGITIDDDGFMHMSEEPVRQPRVPSGPVDRTDPVSGGHQDAGNFPAADDNDYMMLQDDLAFDLGQADETLPVAGQAETQQETSSQSAQAAVRRNIRPPPKIIPLDGITELHNRELARWSAEYFETMREASRHKKAVKAAALAKKNAEHWVLGSLGSFLGQGMCGPLDIFSGVKLLEAFTGINPVTGQKRAREEDGSDNDRRVRSRGEPTSDEMARGFHDDNDRPMMMDDTIEQGREAPTPLEERQLSSLFPWNQSAGSRRPTDMHARSGSLAGTQQLGPLGRRGSRLTSASPLIGRGVLDEPGFQDDYMMSGSNDAAMGGMIDDNEFEMFGAAANVDTQTAEQSQWQRTTLVGESGNFHEFVQGAIDEADQARVQAVAGDKEDEQLVGSIDFDMLLPPETNSQIVAAQALLHVLTLGTKHLLKVRQDEAFGTINLRIIAV